jgi:hypothetical protein
MSLQDEIDRARANIRADAYAMSIGEWINLYVDEEVDIHPEFQRFYRWSPFQKSRFIESIVLGIPVPPIFVAQSEEGIWDVVDGLQRLSTLFEFAGVLKDENGEDIPPLVLMKTKHLPSLENKRWNDPGDPEHSLSVSQRLYIKRAKLDVSVILRESSDFAKYELFQRLNTGGSPLSPQEVRNCIIVQLDREFYFWLRSLADNEDFKECIALTDKAISEQYDVELVLRFLILRQMNETELTEMGDVGEFLTDAMVSLISEQQMDQTEEEEVFRSTFENIARILGPDAFRRYDPDKRKHLGGFLLSAFETVALGIGSHGGQVSGDDATVAEKVRGLWSNEHFQNWSGSGVRASYRIPKLIPLGRQVFEP